MRCGHILRVCIALFSMTAWVRAGGIEWGELPDLPDAEGFAGVYAGTARNGPDEFLIVAGGANFPAGRPWEGGLKVYSDAIYSLSPAPGAAWTKHPLTLPVPSAYGMSVSLPEQGVCLFMGGKTAAVPGQPEHPLDSVLQISFEAGALKILPLTPLPLPVAEGVAVLTGKAMIVAAGSTQEAGKWVTARQLWTAAPDSDLTWKALLWPEEARGRMYAIAATRQGKFYLFGGRDYAAPGESGDAVQDGLTFLKDAWSLEPVSEKWQRLTDLPRAISAAPSPAIPSGASHLLIPGGVDVPFLRDQLAARPSLNGQGMEHPGFPGNVLAYDVITDTWVEAGSVPSPAPVTTPVVFWNGASVIPTGEIKPGVRSPRVLTGKPGATRMHFGWLNWAVVTLYLGSMIWIGYRFMKKESGSSTEAYFRGGKRVPWWVAGLSIFATMLSALTFMGIPARAYQTDISWYTGQLPILLVVPLVALFYLPFFRKLDLTSAYEYLERRFNLATRLIASASFMLFQIGRIGIVLYLPALALAAVSDIGVVSAILIIGVLCVIYTLMGGIEAVVWTDAVQALVLMGGAALCLGLVIWRVDGGAAGVWEVARTDHKLFENLSWNTADMSAGTTSAFVLFIAFFFNSFVPYTSSQDVVQRYVTTRDLTAAKKSMWLTMWMSVFGSLIFFALGVAVYAYYKLHPAQLDPGLERGDSILPFFVIQQLPAGVSGLVIAAIFAAAQSTVSSSLNSVATAWSKDFDQRIIRPDASDQAFLSVAKIVVVACGVFGIGLAVVMAFANIESAFQTFQTLLGLTAGPLGGLFALGVFTRRANGTGALIGVISGFLCVAALEYSGSGVTGLLYAGIGFSVCLVAGYLASLAAGGNPGRNGLSIHG